MDPPAPSQAARSPGRTAAGSSAQRIPKVIAGFELTGKLGQGGMGAVFKARQVSMDRFVALKVLPPRLAQNANFIERFQREARASARITHPNVVQGIDVGCDTASGLWYFAMELVEGESLRDRLDRDGHLGERDALTIAREIAAGLDAAHRAGLVHRDIKPDNIMITATGAKILDLGLAKQQDDDATLTQTGVSMGTPLYMAPEQVRGQLDSIDTRTDLYALGATVFHLLTGRPPFQGQTSAVILSKHLTEPAPRANDIRPGISAGAADLVARLMEKDQAKRPADPATVIRAIDRLLTGASPAGQARRGHAAGRPRPAGRMWKGFIAATIVLLLAAGAWIALRPAAAAPPGVVKDQPVAVAVPAAPAVLPASALPPASTPSSTEAPRTPAGAPPSLAERVAAAEAWDRANPTKSEEAAHRYRRLLQWANGNPEHAGLARRLRAALTAAEARNPAAPAPAPAPAPVTTNAAPVAGTPVKTSQFLAVRSPMTWDEAKAHCEQHGGRLACIKTKADREQILSVGSSGDWWIGASWDGSQYVWLDGTPVDGAAGIGLRTDDAGKETALRLKRDGNKMLFDDRTKTAKFPFIIEKR